MWTDLRGPNKLGSFDEAARKSPLMNKLQERGFVHNHHRLKEIIGDDEEDNVTETAIESATDWDGKSAEELHREYVVAEARVAALAVAKAKLLATQLAMDHRAAGTGTGLKIAPGLDPQN